MTERKSEKVRMNEGRVEDGDGDGAEGAECTRGEETDVAWKGREGELERVFERNMAAPVSGRLKTSALCKNNLSNNEERLPAFSTRDALL